MSGLRISFILLVFLSLLGFAGRSSFGRATRENLDGALLSASRNGNAAKIKSLLAKGANPNGSNANGDTPLMLLLQSRRYIRTPTSASAPTYHRDGTITVTFQLPAGNAMEATAPATETVKALLRRGANVNAANHQGNTPLMFAAGHPMMDCFKLLLSHGADIHASAADGTNVLFWAVGYGHTQRLALLLSKGLDPNAARNSDGATPLMLEVAGGNVHSVKLLLDHGANIYAADKNGGTALQYAKEARNTAVVKLLMSSMGLSL